MVAQIWEYQQQQQAQLVNHCVEICAAIEEKFFDQVVRVVLEAFIGSGISLLVSMGCSPDAPVTSSEKASEIAKS